MNIKTSVLKDLLINNRNFAYEQTLNFIIKCWDYDKAKWKYNITTSPLGSLSDNKSLRDYRSCIDQIERIENAIDKMENGLEFINLHIFYLSLFHDSVLPVKGYEC